MIETEITIVVNRKSDFDVVKQKIIESNIQVPVYIFELASLYRIELVSDNEEWELDNKILSCFPGYEFTRVLGKGGKEIRIEITRQQSPLSTDGWGRQIEDPLNETKYLVKKLAKLPENELPQVSVLFGESEQHYFIHIVDGINKVTNEKGFLLLNDFKTKNETNNAEILKDKRYKTANEAFYSGYYKLQETVREDYKKYVEVEKKKVSELHKAPRKTVRSFIDFCNQSQISELLKLLDDNVIFEKRFQWQTKMRTEGILQFEEYLNSPTQDLCSKSFKIRSTWNINLPVISIGVKFVPHPDEIGEGKVAYLNYRQFSFKLNNTKIAVIIEDCLTPRTN